MARQPLKPQPGHEAVENRPGRETRRKVSMTKKMMLLALAVAALFALPAAASAQEAHVSGIEEFTGHAPTGFLSASGEPKITCTTTTVNGSFDPGSSTTGNITLDFTGCAAELLGIKGACNTAGSATGTIASSGTFHVITVNNKPGILVTPVTTTIICINFSRVEVTGNIIGTITSPACGESSETLVTEFSATGSTQNHLEYTGVNYDLKVATETSAGSTTSGLVTAGLTSTATLSSPTEGTLECT
jgi:hypothetical protein